MQTVTLSGLHCEACTKIITKKLSKLSGVSAVTSSSPIGEFQVESTPLLTESDINQAITGTDYTLVSIK